MEKGQEEQRNVFPEHTEEVISIVLVGKSNFTQEAQRPL